MLHNRPVSLGVDYFINNLKETTSRTDVAGGGFLKRKLKSGTGENEEAVKKGGVYGPIDYVWMFKVLRTKYREPDGSHIVRIAKQLSEIEGIILRELEVWVRNPEGVWGWLGEERRDHKSSGRYLTNREMPNYFK